MTIIEPVELGNGMDIHGQINANAEIERVTRKEWQLDKCTVA